MGNELTIRVEKLQQIRNLFTYVDAKNKQSKAFLESGIAELDAILKPYEQTKEEKKNG